MNVYFVFNIIVFGMVRKQWFKKHIGSLSKLKGFTLSLKEIRCVHDSMNRPKIEFIT